jgi:type IV secretory pathway VirB2 component (pilin)
MTPPSSKPRRLAGLAVLLLVIAAVALVALPLWLIRPFSPQTPGGVALAYALRQAAPWGTLVALAAALVLGMNLWRGARWWSRAVLVVALVPLAGAVWLSRQNVFEKMFAPLPDPRFARAAEASWMKEGDMVMGVERNGDAVAYPVRQLAYHHVVMDEVGGQPVVATY